MASRKRAVKESKGERASVSRERRIALALRAVLDASEGAVFDNVSAEFQEAQKTAITTLDELGYGTLVGIPKRIAELEGQLHAAMGANDYGTVARLGLELERVKAGRVSRTVEPAGE